MRYLVAILGFILLRLPLLILTTAVNLLLVPLCFIMWVLMSKKSKDKMHDELNDYIRKVQRKNDN